MKLDIGTDRDGGHYVSISEAYTGLVIETRKYGPLHICHRDDGIEVWEAKKNGRLLWTTHEIKPEREK